MPNTMLAVVPREQLSSALTRFHRAGYGHVIKVMDPDRAAIPAQLSRAGVQTSRLAEQVPPGNVLLFVPSPARTSDAAVIAHGAGALDIELVDCGDPVTWSLPSTLQHEVVRRHERRRSHAASSEPTETAD